MQVVVTCRAIIIHDGKLLMCRHPKAPFWCLPGGKLEPGETIEAGMKRELIEETSITPVVSRLLFVNQFINADNHRVEFFFRIENSADFASFNPNRASHSFEIAKFMLADPATAALKLKPDFLKDRFTEIVAQGERFQTEIMVSH